MSWWPSKPKVSSAEAQHAVTDLTAVLNDENRRLAVATVIYGKLKSLENDSCLRNEPGSTNTEFNGKVEAIVRFIQEYKELPLFSGDEQNSYEHDAAQARGDILGGVTVRLKAIHSSLVLSQSRKDRSEARDDIKHAAEHARILMGFEKGFAARVNALLMKATMAA